jgi:hypothetical protein
MMPVRSLRKAAAFFGLLFFIGAADAHRQPVGLTAISFNADSGTTEIVHRFHRHDAELGLVQLLRKADVLLIDLESQARFALYVAENFAMAPAIGAEPLALELVGAELEGDEIIIYQEYAGKLPDQVAIRDAVLQDVYADQVNHVNVHGATGMKTASFTVDDGWKAL